MKRKLRAIEEVNKIVEVKSYKSGISGELFSTYQEAYDDDCERFADSFLEDCDFSGSLLKPILDEEGCCYCAYELNSRKELDMFLYGCKVGGFSKTISKEALESIKEFPVILLDFYDSNKLFILDEVVEILEKQKQELINKFKK